MDVAPKAQIWLSLKVQAYPLEGCSSRLFVVLSLQLVEPATLVRDTGHDSRRDLVTWEAQRVDGVSRAEAAGLVTQRAEELVSLFLDSRDFANRDEASENSEKEGSGRACEREELERLTIIRFTRGVAWREAAAVL